MPPNPTINDAINAIMQTRAQSRGPIWTVDAATGRPISASNPLGRAGDQAQLTQAVQQAQQRYPWVRNLGVPIKLFMDTGPGWSESYDPKTEDTNPYPGQFGIGLRSKKAMDPQNGPPLIGREAIDYMARHDPVYQGTAAKFRTLMTPFQLKMARKRYDSDPSIQKDYSFEEFLNKAENQEFIGAYVGDMGDWRKTAGYTPKQKTLLDKLSNYMWQGQTPHPLGID